MFLKIAGVILAGYTAVFGLFCLVALQSGIALIDVANHRDGSRIFVPIPMILGNVGASLLPDRALRDIRRELGPHREMVNAAIDELRSCPDGPFVEVESHGDHVLIEKSGDNLIVDVHSKKEDVYVRVPLRGTKKFIAQLTAER
jgi:hypothetical protein